MQKISSKLTVFYDGQFWVGVVERIYGGQLEVSKTIFGPEPNNSDIYQFYSRNWDDIRFSSPVKADDRGPAKTNPKRLQRQIKRQVSSNGIGTKSQQALKLQHEENKMCLKAKRRRMTEEEKRRKFEQRQKKRKEKHKGR